MESELSKDYFLSTEREKMLWMTKEEMKQKQWKWRK